MSAQGNLTELAQKYTHPTGPRDAPIATIYPLKSGLTPVLLPVDPNFEDIENYQRQLFYGFTASELLTVDSLAHFIKDDMPPSPNTWTIHPMYQKKNWQYPLPHHLARFPLGKGRRGYWDVDNPDVPIWRVMQPALKLASLFLTNAQHWPWFDALTEGDWDVIPKQDMPVDVRNRPDQWTRFRARQPQRVYHERHTLLSKFVDAADFVEFHFVTSHTNTESGMPLGRTSREKLTKDRGHYVARRDMIVVLVQWELLEPLLRTDLTAAERAVQDHLFAVHLLRETCEVMYHICKGEKVASSLEPYFEDDPIRNLPWSMETEVFGGSSNAIITSSHDANFDGTPAGGVFLYSWPNRLLSGIFGDLRHPELLRKPHDWWSFSRYPIPVTCFMNFHREEFWSNHIMKYGSASTRLPRTIGTVQNIFDEGDQWTGQYALPKELYSTFLASSLSQPFLNDSMTEPERQAAYAENARRQRANDIHNARNGQAVGKNIDIDYFPLHTGDDKLPDPIDKNQCPRYDEIRSYLLKNKDGGNLALNTMKPTPEHILFNYIRENGEITMTPEEWRTFLIVATHANEFFRYTISRLSPIGIVSRIDGGWGPPAPDFDRRFFRNLPFVAEIRRHIMPSREELIDFDEAARGVWNENVGTRFDNKYLDYDEMDFLRLINRWFRVHGHRHMWRTLGLPFNTRIFRAAIYWSRLFTKAPKGVVRFRRPPA